MKAVHFVQVLMLVTIGLALSCARQTSPTGGPKDTIPPTLIRTIPDSQEVNVQGQVIEATFSESIQLNNAKDQIIITPGVGKDFQATAKKNKVVINLNHPLQPNTTYTVNFREAVQDITEKNPAANVHFAFSTGTYIDSLHLFGNVYELLTAKEGKDATVALYEQDTFNIFRHKPAYFTKADAAGNFHLDNLKPGSYRIYAWLDNNKNLLVDSKSESYGFLPETLHPQDSTFALKIPLTKLDSRPLKITSARPSQTIFNIKTSKSTEIFSVTSKTYKLLASYGTDHENIQVYNNMQLEANDSIPFTFIARDSLLQSVDTILYLKFSQRIIKPQPFQFSTDQFSVSGTTGQLRGIITFNKPIALVNHDSLFYRIDSAHVAFIQPTDITFDTTRTQITIHKQLDRSTLQPKPVAKPSITKPTKAATTPPVPAAQKSAKGPAKPAKIIIKDYDFNFPTGAFISAERDTSKATSINIKPTTLESTGVIILTVKSTRKPLLVQLISKGTVIASQPAGTKTTFQDLTPGDYSIRVVVDLDNNNRWSPGNIFRNQPPEPIYFYRTEEGKLNITLKANWERELLITF
jgi:uncharacterized protein (DUF2141 family)